MELAQLHSLLIDTLAHLLLFFDLLQLLHEVIVLPRLRNQLRYHVVYIFLDFATSSLRGWLQLRLAVLVVLRVLVVLAVLLLILSILSIEDVLLGEEQFQVSLTASSGLHLDEEVLPCEEPLISGCQDRETQGVVEMAVAVRLFGLGVGEGVEDMQVFLRPFL